MQNYVLDYIPSQPPYTFQGTQTQLQAHLKRNNARIFGGGNGTWIVGVPPYRMIYEYIDGEHTRSASPDRFLYNNGLQKITKKSCETLCDKLNQGIIKFDQLI